MKGVLAVTAAAVLFAGAARPAAAAFPGTNGPIAAEANGANGAVISIVNADGTGARPGVVAVGPDDRDPAWSPDGRRLAFTSTRDGNEEIYLLDVASGAQTRLTFDPAQDHDPSWSPDGGRLVFASNRDTDSDLYVMSAAGGAATRITSDPAVDQQPAWSTGRAIAFASNRGGDMDIYTIDEQGGTANRVTGDPGQDADPSWAPDSSRLAYSHGDTGVQLFTIGTDGQNKVALGPGHFPAWSPDGTRIAFSDESPFGSIRVMPSSGQVPGLPPTAVMPGRDPNWGPLPPPPPAPDVGRTIAVAPVDARVLIAPATNQPPSTNPVLQAQLRTPSEVSVGSTINASAGTVGINAVTTTPDGPGTVGTATVTGGIFTVGQVGTGEPSLHMLPGIRPCQQTRASMVPPEARMRIRARGRFRSVGGYGRGAARGTEWSMRERCDGTVFQVFEGVVLVHDFRRRLTFQVRAGRCYLAASKRRSDALKPKRECPPVRSHR